MDRMFVYIYKKKKLAISQVMEAPCNQLLSFLPSVLFISIFFCARNFLVLPPPSSQIQWACETPLFCKTINRTVFVSVNLMLQSALLTYLAQS